MQKCYCQSNFQTLTQIIHGLQSPDVERLKKTWARVPTWEMRKFRSMKIFVSHLRNVRPAVLPLYASSLTKFAPVQAPSRGHDGFDHRVRTARTARTFVDDTWHDERRQGGCRTYRLHSFPRCAAFVSSTRPHADPPLSAGLFLRDLTLNAELPTFLDPTSTNTPASVDETGSLSHVANPYAFAHLPQLPDDVPLRPLVNVHKFRLMAGIVQRVLAFQEFAEGYPYQVDPNVYFKCLKIRCLEPSVMRECSLRLAQA